jgi:hypothetical protein
MIFDESILQLSKQQRAKEMKNLILNQDVKTNSCGVLLKDSFVQLLEPGKERSRIRVDNKELFVNNSIIEETNKV